MKFVTIAFLSASSLLIVLCSLLFTLQNPEQALYDKTVKELMIREKLNTPEAVLNAFPALKAIQHKMEKTKHLRTMVNSKTQGPAPAISEDENLYLQKQMEKIRQLRKEINEDLKRLVATHSSIALKDEIGG